MSRLSVSVFAICFFASSPLLWAQVTYLVDDGVSDSAPGQGNGGDLLWGNYFNELPNGNVIESLSLAFRGVPVGRAFQVAVYDDLDNDGDPSTNLSLLTSVADTVSVSGPVGTDTFQLVDIPDTVISDGFFIAAYMDGTGNPFPAKLDQTASQLQSWFAEHNTSGAMDITDPFGSATLSGRIDDAGFPGNWLLRANAIPEPSSAALALASFALFLYRRHQRRQLLVNSL